MIRLFGHVFSICLRIDFVARLRQNRPLVHACHMSESVWAELLRATWRMMTNLRGFASGLPAEIFSWRIPPNWSVHDWLDEVKAMTAAARCQARA